MACCRCWHRLKAKEYNALNVEKAIRHKSTRCCSNGKRMGANKPSRKGCTWRQRRENVRWREGEKRNEEVYRKNQGIIVDENIHLALLVRIFGKQIFSARVMCVCVCVWFTWLGSQHCLGSKMTALCKHTAQYIYSCWSISNQRQHSNSCSCDSVRCVLLFWRVHAIECQTWHSK